MTETHLKITFNIQKNLTKNAHLNIRKAYVEDSGVICDRRLLISKKKYQLFVAIRA